jgi:hypothetical protein
MAKQSIEGNLANKVLRIGKTLTEGRVQAGKEKCIMTCG